MAKKGKFNPAVFLAGVDGGRTVSHYRKGQVIFTQDDAAESVFFIQKGRVKLSVVSERGKEAVVGFLGAGDFIGEACLNHRPRRMATASAITDCDITKVTKSTMIKTLQDQPKFSALFMAYLLHRTVRVEEDLVDQLFNSSEKRLARALLTLGKFWQGRGT